MTAMKAEKRIRGTEPDYSVIQENYIHNACYHNMVAGHKLFFGLSKTEKEEEMKARKTIHYVEAMILEKLSCGYRDFEIRFNVGNCRYLVIVSGDTVEVGSIEDDTKQYPRINERLEKAIKDHFPISIQSPPFTLFTL